MQRLKLQSLMLACVLASAGCASMQPAPRSLECPEPPPAPPLALLPFPDLQTMLDAIITPYAMPSPAPAPATAPAKLP